MRELTGGFSCLMGAQRLIILEVPPVERLVRPAARRGPNGRRSLLAHSHREAARTLKSEAGMERSGIHVR